MCGAIDPKVHGVVDLKVRGGGPRRVFSNEP